VLQEFWWHGLATCICRMGQLGGLSGYIGPMHPCMRHLAAYCSPAYSDQLAQASQVAYPKLFTTSSQLVHVLLVRELWGLLPWQLPTSWPWLPC